MASEKINGFEFHYTEQGRGEAIVLLHGYPLDGRVWDAVARPLAERYRVIVPDLRGFGRSKSDAAFTMTSLAEDVHALVEKLGAKPCVMGGLSMGGYVTLQYARRYPRELRGVMMINSKAEADNSEQKEAREAGIKLLKEKGMGPVAEQMLPKMVSPGTLKRGGEPVERLKKIMLEQSPTAMQHALAAMRDRDDSRDFVHSIAEPVLIIAGVDDGIVPLKLSEELHRETERSELVILSDAGHMTPMEQPGKVVEAITRFMERV